MAQDIKLRKKDLKEPDQFQVAGGDFLDFLTHNKSLLIGLLAALMAIGGGYLFITNQKKAEISRMETLYFEMTRKMEDHKGGVDNQLISELKSLLDQFKPGDARNRAQVLLADIQYQAGKYDDAITLYKEIASQSTPGSMNFNIAQSGMAHAYESQRDFKSAVEHLRKIIDRPGEFPLFYIYLDTARCYEQAGDSKNAVLILREMETKFPEHADLEKAKQALGRLEGAA